MAAALPIDEPCNRSLSRGFTESHMNAKELRLHRLIDLTYDKIEELKGLLHKESAILGRDVQDSSINPIIQRQNRLMNLAIQVYSPRTALQPLFPRRFEEDRAIGSSRKHSVSFKIDKEDQSSPRLPSSHTSRTPNDRDRRVYRQEEISIANQLKLTNKEELKPAKVIEPPVQRCEFKFDPTWYGSLDRNFAKKKKQVALDKRRRHTKTVGSMAGLDFIKRSQELRPDEQYEIGLPRVTSPPTSKNSTVIHATLSHPSLPAGWGPGIDCVDKDNHFPTSRSSFDRAQRYPQYYPQYYPRHRGVVEMETHHIPCKYEIVKTSPRFDDSLSSPRETQNSKSWFETNLDDGAMSSQLSPLLSSSIVGSSSGSGISSGGIEESFSRLQLSTNVSNETHELHSKNSESNESYSGFTNESTKPFEMSDYYKYSTKFRNQKQRSRKHKMDPDTAKALQHIQMSLLTPNQTTEEKNKNLIKLFSLPGTIYTENSESWLADDDAEVTYSYPVPSQPSFSAPPPPPPPPVPVDDDPAWPEKRKKLIDYFTKVAEKERLQLENCGNAETTISSTTSTISAHRINPDDFNPFNLTTPNIDYRNAETPISPTTSTISAHRINPDDFDPFNLTTPNINYRNSFSRHDRRQEDEDDVNGNPTAGPKLPPRLSRDTKPTVSRRLYKRMGASTTSTPPDSADDNFSWLMEPPTYV